MAYYWSRYQKASAEHNAAFHRFHELLMASADEDGLIHPSGATEKAKADWKEKRALFEKAQDRWMAVRWDTS